MTLLFHFRDMATGIAASLCVLAALLALGVAVRFKKTFDTTDTVHATLLGTTVAVLWCWYSIKPGIPLRIAIEALMSLTAIILLIKWKKRKIVFSALGTLRFQISEFVVCFCIFYCIIYFFTMRSVSPDELPIARISNNDIFNYINITQFLQRLGPSNISGLSIIDSPILMYSFTPAVFTFISGVAFFFGGETIHAAMPTIFALGAIIACVVTGLARKIFLLPRSVALLIATILITGPFFRYVLGNYFLSTFVATLIVLLLIRQTVITLISGTSDSVRQMTFSYTPYYFLLFYSYPPLLIIGLGLQGCLVGLWLTLSRFAVVNGPEKTLNPLSFSKRSLLAVTASLLLVAIVDFDHARKIIHFLRFISQSTGIGWSLGFISPLAVLGLPVPLVASNAIAIGWQVAIFAVILLLALSRLRQLNRPSTPIAVPMLALSILSFFAYFAFFYHLGPSYQQWKMASYLPLPISFSILCTVAVTGMPQASSNFSMARSRFIILGCAALILANAISCVEKEQPLESFSSNYSNLQALDMIDGAHDIYIDMKSFSATFLPVYFVRTKLLHLMSPSYYPQESFSFKNASREHPIFIEGDACDVESRNVSISGVGCLYVSPPGLRVEHRYFFGKEIPGLVDDTGLSAREDWGRWTDGNTAHLQFLIDQKGLSDTKQSFINFEVQPFLYRGIQNIVIKWGNGHDVGIAVPGTQWISVPFSKSDMIGSKLNELSLTILLPDAIAPHEINAGDSEVRHLGLGLISVSVTADPLGKVIDEKH